MMDIVICIFGIAGVFACRIIENVMWGHDREKVLGYEFEHHCGARTESE